MLEKALPLVTLIYVGVTTLLPTLRTWRQTGRWPLTFARSSDPLQRFMGAVLGMVVAALVLWVILVATLGTGPLGVWQRPEWCGVLGYALMVMGGGIEVMAHVQMGNAWRMGIDTAPTPLVTSGLFRIVRNPVFTGFFVSLLGIVLVTPSPWTVMGYVFAAVLITMQTYLEERHLSELHGPAYQHYAQVVGRFVPWVGRLDGTTLAHQPAVIENPAKD